MKKLAQLLKRREDGNSESLAEDQDKVDEVEELEAVEEDAAEVEKTSNGEDETPEEVNSEEVEIEASVSGAGSEISAEQAIKMGYEQATKVVEVCAISGCSSEQALSFLKEEKLESDVRQELLSARKANAKQQQSVSSSHMGEDNKEFSYAKFVESKLS